MPADSPTTHPAVAAAANAFAAWIDAVHSTRDEIRAEITDEGGDPDVDARLRQVLATARDELDEPGRAAFDWVITGMRDHLDATEARP